ncbi:hypothetical protein JKP88DRAFT_347184 [Tribonema minus]|uniref:Uncharacterized protein n=1 Tax=Tribonema minus TaxID=303371 RepID=A0A835YHG1_9STRA|nr:hypothetical protein JKP88DRAFT_347184 [Tribonema minus]
MTHNRRPSLLRAESGDEDAAAASQPVSVAEEKKEETKQEVVPMDMSLPTINLDAKDQDKSYPIDFPAYGLLSLSTVVAIAFVGSIFEVAGPSPLLGYVPTYIIGALSLPGFIFLFYAAIKKGQAEAEEDDDDFY